MPISFTDTRAYAQIQAHVEEFGGDLHGLCSSAMQSAYDQSGTLYYREDDTVDSLFIWADTPEGQGFWEEMNASGEWD